MIGKAKEEIGRFDVIHMHSYRTFQNVVVAYYAQKYGIPYVLNAHASIPRIIQRQNLKALYDYMYGYKILRKASKLMAVSKVVVEQYKQMAISDDKIVVEH